MNIRLANALATGIGAFIMVYVAMTIKSPTIVAWGAFLGSSSFFLSLNDNDNKLNMSIRNSLFSNIIGALMGFGCVYFGGSTAISNAIVTALFSILIILLTRFEWLKNGSVTFIGGATVFATTGNLKLALTSLLFGNLIGYLSLKLGNGFFKKTNKK